MTDTRKVCFVVMGFGKKTDYETGRTLDLDATYEVIIRPVAESLDLRCIRADEILQSGVIDVKMYEMLLRAELVIADISTGNVNALYELGVRHALRPRATIIMKEQLGRLYFDLNHVNTFQYEHLGKDIGAREATRARTDLQALITAALASAQPDSPVYTFLPALQHPRLSDSEYARLLEQAEAAEEQFASLIRAGEQAAAASDHQSAAKCFAQAAERKPEDPYLIQQWALHLYKTELPSILSALIDASGIIARLRPESSNDPETLGIAGAIAKRIWKQTKDLAQLNLAISFYRRGYEVRRDYYNGENLATCYDLRAEVQSSADEAQYDRMSAQKVRQSLLETLIPLSDSASIDQLSDRRWIFATIANCSFALQLSEQGENYERRFLSENPADWELATYRANKETILKIARKE